MGTSIMVGFTLGFTLGFHKLKISLLEKNLEKQDFTSCKKSVSSSAC
jgi:hypothetical protein